MGRGGRYLDAVEEGSRREGHREEGSVDVEEVEAEGAGAQTVAEGGEELVQVAVEFAVEVVGGAAGVLGYDLGEGPA